mgnify:CR=1 FL=1
MRLKTHNPRTSNQNTRENPQHLSADRAPSLLFYLLCFQNRAFLLTTWILGSDLVLFQIRKIRGENNEKLQIRSRQRPKGIQTTTCGRWTYRHSQRADSWYCHGQTPSTFSRTAPQTISKKKITRAYNAPRSNQERFRSLAHSHFSIAAKARSAEMP